MRVFERIAIGTANWGEKPYGHCGVTCPRSEQEEILAYCMACGIDTLCTKAAYGVNLSWVNSSFVVVQSDEAPNYSLYDPHEWDTLRQTCSVLQVPYSPFNRVWEDTLAVLGEIREDPAEVHVRSCFVQGKVFHSNEPVFVRFRACAHEMGMPVGTLCLLFCLLNPRVDKVILGVDSVAQLREDLRFFHRLDGFGVDDPKIVDPRLWPTTSPSNAHNATG